MVLLPYMNWGNLKLFLRQCKLVEANNPQVHSEICRLLACYTWFVICVCVLTEIVLVFTCFVVTVRELASVCLESYKENIPGCAYDKTSEGMRLS